MMTTLDMEDLTWDLMILQYHQQVNRERRIGMKAYEVETNYIIIAESMSEATKLWKAEYEEEPNGIRKIADYVLVQGIDDVEETNGKSNKV